MGKDRYDGLYQLAEQAWRDWDHKTKYQWRLSFSIWGTQLAATSAVISEKVPISSVYGFILIVAVILIHVFFMSWIEVRIRYFRSQMYTYVGEMEKMVNICSAGLTEFREKKKEDNDCKRFFYSVFAWFLKPAARVQILITILLAMIFWLALKSIESGVTNSGSTAA